MFGAHLAPTGGAAGGTTMKGKGRVLLHGKRAGEMTWMLKDFDLTAGHRALACPGFSSQHRRKLRDSNGCHVNALLFFSHPYCD
jgi:hypothetical protein